MSEPIMSTEEFENTRVARFKDLQSSKLPLLDAVIPGCEREIYNISDEKAMIMATVGGTDPGKCGWHKDVVAEAEKRGYKLAEDGNMEKIGATAE